MAFVRQMVAGLFATLLAWSVMPSQAQPGPVAGLHIEALDVEQVPQLTSGTQLNFSLFGTPGGVATLHIDGARRELGLHEVQAGIYEGTYTLDAQDRVGPDSRVTAVLKRDQQVARSMLEEPLLLGAPAPAVPAAPIVDRGRIDERAPGTLVPRIGTPVPRATQAGCVDCALVESMRPVEVGGSEGYVGAIAGGVLGAILGDQLGQGDGRRVARIIGVLGGALAGREIERNGSRRTRYDVVLRLPSGAARLRSYDSPPPFKVGDTIRLDAATVARAGRSASAYSSAY